MLRSKAGHRPEGQPPAGAAGPLRGWPPTTRPHGTAGPPTGSCRCPPPRCRYRPPAVCPTPPRSAPPADGRAGPVAALPPRGGRPRTGDAPGAACHRVPGRTRPRPAGPGRAGPPCCPCPTTARVWSPPPTDPLALPTPGRRSARPPYRQPPALTGPGGPEHATRPPCSAHPPPRANHCSWSRRGPAEPPGADALPEPCRRDRPRPAPPTPARSPAAAPRRIHHRAVAGLPAVRPADSGAPPPGHPLCARPTPKASTNPAPAAAPLHQGLRPWPPSRGPAASQQEPFHPERRVRGAARPTSPAATP